MQSRVTNRQKDILLILIAGAAYFAFARLGLALATAPKQVTAIWPPTGIAISLLVLGGYRFWPAVTLGAFTANILANETFPVALCISIGNTLQALASTYIFKRISRDITTLHHIRGLSGFLAGATLGTLCSATIGTTALLAGGLIANTDFQSVWLLWWLGDSLGAIVVGPLILTWMQRDSESNSRAGVIESATCLLAISVVGYVIFGGGMPDASQMKFVFFPLLIWSAYRLEQRLTAISILLLAGIVLGGLLTGSDAIRGASLNEKLLVAQSFMAVVAVTAMVIGSVAKEQRETQASLRKTQEQLEERIRERTAELEVKLHALSRAETDLKNSYDQLEVRVQERTAELTSTTDALRLSEQHLQAIMDHSTAVIHLKDAEGRYMLVNREWESVNNKRRENIIGRTVFDVYPAEIASKLAANDQIVLQGGKALQFEEIVPHNSHGDRIFLSNKFPLLDINGKPYAICGIATDITERKRVEERERLARETAEQANRAKDEFLAVVSHELRTPLSPILGWTRMLRARKVDVQQVDHALEVIERNVRVQAQLIEDLLDISRIITGKLRITIKPMNLVTVIEAALETVRPAAESKSITILSDIDESHDVVRGDPERLQQVVWNLLANAIKFTPRSGIIRVQLKRVETNMVISVQDNGQGIAPDFLPFMFNRFSQADSSTTRRTGGLGLGLAIVRHIVELHGGTVSVESSGVNMGATFKVVLPVSSMAVSTDETPSGYRKRMNATNLGTALQGMRILVVDDEPDMLEFVGSALEKCGASVDRATSVGEAIPKVQNLHPDVIVSDIAMPGEDGYSLIKKLRELPENGTPAIALTAYARTEDRARILSAGFRMHIAKPVDPVELANAVASLVQK